MIQQKYSLNWHICMSAIEVILNCISYLHSRHALSLWCCYTNNTEEEYLLSQQKQFTRVTNINLPVFLFKLLPKVRVFQKDKCQLGLLQCDYKNCSLKKIQWRKILYCHLKSFRNQRALLKILPSVLFLPFCILNTHSLPCSL